MRADEHRNALVHETANLVDGVRGANPTVLRKPTPCDGWTVLDVARHVSITPLSPAANLTADWNGAQPAPVEALPDDAPPTYPGPDPLVAGS